jgi:hypothetical protein
MTIIEKSTFTGVPISECRPFARVRMGQQLKKIAQDQALAHKALTGVAVPNAPGSDVATDHTHDGTTGAGIPIPVAQEWLGASLDRPSNLGGYAPVIFFPVFAPPGYTKWKLHLTTRTPGALQSMVRVKVMNASLQTIDGAGTLFVRDRELPGDVTILTSTLTLGSNQLNVIRLEANESSTAPAADLMSYSLVPYFGEPDVRVMTLDYPDENETIVAPVPGEHLGTYPFTSYDDSMFDDDTAVSSYLVNTLNKNNIWLTERATGIAAGNRDVSSNALWEGHGHGGRTTTATRSTNLGAELHHSLGAWAYGTRRGWTTGSHPTDDMANTSNTTWRGRLFAPCLINGVTAAQEVVRHPVRLPLMSATGKYAHSTGSLNFAALVAKDDFKNGNIGVTAQMRSSSGASAGTAQTVSTSGSSNGIYLLTISGLDAQGTTDGDVEQMLSVSLAYTTNSAPGSVIYGTCLWIDP